MLKLATLGLLLTLMCGQSYGEDFDANQFVAEQRQIQQEFCANEAAHRKPEYEAKIRTKYISYLGASFRMFIRQDGDDVLNYLIGKNGVWEPVETSTFVSAVNQYIKKKRLSPDSATILDIGANVGWFTFIFGGLGYRVIAIEPDDFNMYLMRKTACINPNMKLTLWQIAVGNETARCDLYRYNDLISYTNTMVYCGKNGTAIKDYIHVARIDIVPLNILAPNITKLVAMKIDIEGFEPAALAGGEQVFFNPSLKFVLSEYNPPELRQRNADGYAYVNSMLNNGYNMAIERCTDRTISNDEARAMAKNYAQNINICFIRNN